MFDIEVAENLERLKKKYYYNMDFYDKLCALSYLLSKDIMPQELTALYNNDIEIMEQNIINLA